MFTLLIICVIGLANGTNPNDILNPNGILINEVGLNEMHFMELIASPQPRIHMKDYQVAIIKRKSKVSNFMVLCHFNLEKIQPNVNGFLVSHIASLQCKVFTYYYC